MERKDLRVGNRLYSLLQPPVLQAMPLCTKTATMLAPAFALLGKDAESISSGNLGKLATIFGNLLQQLNPSEMNELMMEAVEISHLCCDNLPISSKIEFERHFSDKRGEVYQVLLWCLWECVQDFFPMLGNFTQAGLSAAREAFQSQKVGV